MRRGRILILIGLILALGTAGAIFLLLQSAVTPTEAPTIERREVVVAVQPVNEDELVEGRLEMRAMPVESIPEGALTSLSETTGMLAAGPIPQGTIIQRVLLISPQQQLAEGQLGQLVEQGYVAIAMPIGELSSVAYGIRPGDHIDVLMTFYFLDIDSETQMVQPICAPLCPGVEGQVEGSVTIQVPRRAAQLTLQDVLVLGVGTWEEETTTAEAQAEQQQQARGETPAQVVPQNITVMVSRQDALVLKLAREQGASIDYAVRAQDDVEQIQTQQVTLDYLMARFAITVPAKQPYSIEEVVPEQEQQ